MESTTVIYIIVNFILEYFIFYYPLIMSLVWIQGAIFYFFHREIQDDYEDLPDLTDFHPKVSILIPAHNEEEALTSTLKAALASVYPDFEVIVIEPMLEAWLWADAVSTANGFGVANFNDLKNQLVKKNLWNPDEPKPKAEQMKAARNLAAKIGRRSTGSPIFRAMFSSLSSRALNACIEPGFVLLLRTLRDWFPPAPVGGVAP